MALKTLKGISKIDGFDVCRIPDPDMPHDEYKRITEGKFVLINGGKNRITFQIQDGPVKESGVNGCQVDTLIDAARIILEKLNNKLSCPENNMAIASLNDAIGFLKTRKLNRENRGVEGLDKE